MTITTATLKTRKIAGHAITLESGRDYIASRPIASRHIPDQRFDVSIKDNAGQVVHTIPGLTYDAANEVLKKFNNGPTSFVGRIW